MVAFFFWEHVYEIHYELLLMAFIYMFPHKNGTSGDFTGGLTMHRDETSLHPDTGVTSVMFVERSLNEIRFGLES